MFRLRPCLRHRGPGVGQRFPGEGKPTHHPPRVVVRHLRHRLHPLFRRAPRRRARQHCVEIADREAPGGEAAIRRPRCDAGRRLAIREFVFDQPEVAGQPLTEPRAQKEARVTFGRRPDAATPLARVDLPRHHEERDDRLGGDGVDNLLGGDGNDLLLASAGADLIDGGAGVDTTSFAGWLEALVLDLAHQDLNAGAAAGDQLTGIEEVIGTGLGDRIAGDSLANRFRGEGGADWRSGGAGNDLLYGGDGDDTLIGGAGADRLEGGLGRDLVSYADAAQGLKLDMTTVALNTGDAKGDVLVAVEDLEGSLYADTLSGDAGANRIFGLDGSDQLFGRAGNDSLTGGAGEDTLSGGAWAVRLEGGAGGAEAFNLGNGRGYSVAQVVEEVRRVTGHPIPVVLGERRPGDPAVLVASSARAEEVLGWRQRYAELSAIVDTAWSWHRQRFS